MSHGYVFDVISQPSEVKAKVCVVYVYDMVKDENEISKKTKRRSMIMLRITTIVIVLCASAMVAQAQNLLVNGDFETGDLTGWNQDLQASGVFFGVTTNNVPAGSGTYTYEFDTGTSVNNHYGNIEQGGPAHLSGPVMS